MKRAIELSIQRVNSGGGPFGSVIVRENKINLNDEEMRKISSILEQSVMQSFTRVSSRIEKSFNSLLAE